MSLTTNWVIKRYRREDLLDVDWETRVLAIEHLSRQHDIIPTVAYSWSDDQILCYRQRRIKRCQPKMHDLAQRLKQLARALDELSHSGFVHGDINFKNLLFDGQQYRLIDLEPSLRQYKNGRVTLLYTPPYIAVRDYSNECLTQRTDKIGFYFFCRRLLMPIHFFSSRKAMQGIIQKQSFFEKQTGLPENILDATSYESILALLPQQLAL